MSRPKGVSLRYLQPLEPIPTGIAAGLSKMKPCDAILFDVYGTLLVSGAGAIGQDPDIQSGQERLAKLLQRYRIADTPRELKRALTHAIESEHAIRRKMGISFPEVDILCIWRAILKGLDGSLVQRFAMEYEWITNPVFPMPGAATVIRAGLTQKTPLGIISNAQLYTAWVLEDLFGEELYAQGFHSRLRFFSWQERHAKPGETMFWRARKTLESMGISPKSVLYVGNDMLNDTRPAAAVGFQTALFAGDLRSLRTRDGDERCRGLRPDLVVTDLRQLLAAAGLPAWGE